MMRKFWRFLLLAVTGLALMVLSPPIIGQAKEITSVVGLDVNSAVIKDAKGKVYAHDVQLPPGEYTVNYAWSIPDTTNIRAGDTMTFTLPSNIHIPEPDDFTLYASSGKGSIGTAHIDQGASFGTITLNKNLQQNTKNRKGWIQVSVENQPTEPTGTVSMSKAASWVDPENPTVINWQLVVHPDDSTMSNPVIKDTFSGNQKYVTGSVKATANGQNIPVSASGGLFNNTMTFKLTGSQTTDITVTYQTKTKLPTGADTFNNDATYSDDGGHSATATASIDRGADTTGPENPGTGEPGQKEPITMDKSVSWADPEDQTKLNWSIRVNENGNKLVNPQIIDKLSTNQSYVPGSAKLVNAYGDKIIVAVSSNGSGTALVFKASGTYTSSLHLTYQTQPTATKGLETFTNDATYTDDSDNHATAEAEIDRTVEPEIPTAEPITMKKAVTWADPEDQTKLNWSLDVAANGNKLVNPTIVDKMSPNQSYEEGSAQAVTATGEKVPVTAEANGTEIEFKLSGTYTDNLRLTYQTTTDEVGTAATFDNVAVYNDEAGNEASANAAIDREARPVEPAKDPIALNKTATWVDPTDKTKINWALQVTTNGNKLVNPVIKDQLSANQTYVAGSVTVSDAAGTVPVTATVNGSALTFNLTGDFTDDLTVNYQTTTNNATGAETFDNAAVIDDDNNNHAEANTSIDREAPPVEPVKDPIAMSKTVAWNDPADQTKLNWQLQVTTNGNQLINPTITDRLSDNQTYVADSAKVVDATGATVPVVATANGSTLTLKFTGTLTSDLTVTYQTTTNEATGAATFDNAAILDDQNGNHAEAGTSIDREAPPVEPAKDPIEMSKTATWADENDKTKINWQLQVKTNSNELVNPVIVDELSDNQTYVAGSAEATAADGTIIPLTSSVNGNALTIQFSGNLSSDFTVTYQTTTNAAAGADSFTNAAVIDDNNGNHAEANTSIDREAPPVEPAKDPISLTKTAAWSDPDNHSKINWQLQIKSNGNELVNPVVKDLLSDNQTYVADSVKAVTADGTTVPVVATVTGSEATFKFNGSFNSDLTLTYQTTTNTPAGAATFDNAAVVDDDNGNHAEGGTSIDRENPPVAPVKDPIEMTKVATWADPSDQTKINWTLQITANDNELVNPVITDILSDNQTYVADSAQAVDADGTRLSLSVSVTGNTLTLKLAGTFATNITLTYQTKTNTETGAATFDNAALYTDDNDNNASASTSIEREDKVVPPVEPGKPGPTEPGKPGVTEPGKPGPTEPSKPGVTEPGKPGPTEPGKPGTTGPSQPGTTTPSQPAPTTPTTPAPAKPGTATKPNVTPNQPSTTAPNGTAKAPVYNPTPGRLPQTSEHRNTMIDTVLGLLALLLGLVLGYFDFRRRTL